MRKRTKVLIWITGIWLAVVLFDFIITQIIGHPVLCVYAAGGDMAMYIGLGYAIRILYPLSPIGEGQMSYSYVYWPCFVILLVLLALIAGDIVKAKRSANKTRGNNPRTQ